MKYPEILEQEKLYIKEKRNEMKYIKSFNESLGLVQSYWKNNGRYQVESDTLSKLIPKEGKAKTLHGELMRCSNGLLSEYYENKNINAYETYDDDPDYCYNNDPEGCDPSILADEFYYFISFIEKNIPSTSEILDRVWNIIVETPYMDDDELFADDNQILYNSLHDKVVEFCMSTKDQSIN